MTGCTSSNAATTVTEGDSYYATITASSGYVMTGATVQIKMGGTDVTDLYYSGGVISIPDVSGNLAIYTPVAAQRLLRRPQKSWPHEKR